MSIVIEGIRRRVSRSEKQRRAKDYPGQANRALRFVTNPTDE
jgi:hypothetical protein